MGFIAYGDKHFRAMYSLRLGSWQSCESSVKIHPRPKIQKLYWRAATIVDMALIKCWRAGTDFGVTTGPRQKKLPRALDILSRLGQRKQKIFIWEWNGKVLWKMMTLTRNLNEKNYSSKKNGKSWKGKNKEKEEKVELLNNKLLDWTQWSECWIKK